MYITYLINRDLICFVELCFWKKKIEIHIINTLRPILYKRNKINWLQVSVWCSQPFQLLSRARPQDRNLQQCRQVPGFPKRTACLQKSIQGDPKSLPDQLFKSYMSRSGMGCSCFFYVFYDNHTKTVLCPQKYGIRFIV